MTYHLLNSRLQTSLLWVLPFGIPDRTVDTRIALYGNQNENLNFSTLSTQHVPGNRNAVSIIIQKLELQKQLTD